VQRHNGDIWALADYLVEELANSFHIGAQVWQQNNNHEAKMRLFYDALRRAKLRHKISMEDPK
jgi:hypothetical protein